MIINFSLISIWYCEIYDFGWIIYYYNFDKLMFDFKKNMEISFIINHIDFSIYLW